MFGGEKVNMERNQKIILAVVISSIAVCGLIGVFFSMSYDSTESHTSKENSGAKDGTSLENEKLSDFKFSLENYPETGGFPTDWLEKEHDKILKVCKEASEDGYELPYCEYIQ